VRAEVEEVRSTVRFVGVEGVGDGDERELLLIDVVFVVVVEDREEADEGFFTVSLLSLRVSPSRTEPALRTVVLDEVEEEEEEELLPDERDEADEGLLPLTFFVAVAVVVVWVGAVVLVMFSK
jgi:hypothetical protein